MAKRSYGDAVAHSLGLQNTPSVVTRSLRKSQVGISRLSIGVPSLGMSPRIPPEDSFVMAVYLTDVTQHELWRGGRPYLSQGYRAGSMRIVNLADEYSARILEPHESMVFYIPRMALDEFADEEGGRRIGDLACEPGSLDPVIEHLAGALKPAFEGSEATSSLYVDHAALAVCAHLAHAYGSFRPPRGLFDRAATPWRAERAMAYLADHFDRNVTLAEVARECGLSRGYFIKAFRVATGMTPHQWLQRYRIERAQGLLRDSSLPIADVAIACGFADQSHLTRTFTLMVGCSPAKWRRGCRDTRT